MENDARRTMAAAGAGAPAAAVSAPVVVKMREMTDEEALGELWAVAPEAVLWHLMRRLARLKVMEEREKAKVESVFSKAEMAELWARVKGLRGDDLMIMIGKVYGYCEARPELQGLLKKLGGWIAEIDRKKEGGGR